MSYQRSTNMLIPPVTRTASGSIIHIDESDPLKAEDIPFEPRDVKIRPCRTITDYELTDLLGRGRFGEVRKCKEKKSGKVLAAKTINTERPSDRKAVELEVEVMKSLQHPMLLQLYDALDMKETMTLITEHVSGGELFDRVIDDEFNLTEKACVMFLRQICEGVEFIHNKNVLHLDLKPENILCTTRTGNRIKIIDFGLARFWHPGDKLHILFGTPEFMAPEVVNYDAVGPPADLWSVGVICYVLVSGLSPFVGDNDGETLSNVSRGDYRFDYEEFAETSKECKDFISKLLIKDQRQRLTASQCLQHPWLQRKRKRPLSVKRMKTVKLKKFVARRKWQKMVNTIIAIRRMGFLGSNKDLPPKNWRRTSSES